MVELTKTLRCRLLDPNTGKTGSYERTRKAVNEAASIVAGAVKAVGTNERILHHAVYFRIRRTFGLPAVMIHAVRRKVVGAFRSYERKVESGDEKAQEPDFDGGDMRTIPLGANVLKVIRTDNAYPFVASFRTVDGRVHAPLEVCDRDRDIFEDLTKEDDMKLWKLGKPELVKRRRKNNDEWWLHIAIKRKVDVAVPDETYTALGIDLGLVNIAVASTARGSSTRFWNGKRAGWTRDHYYERRRRLGRAKKLKAIRSSQGAERRWMTDLNHKIASEVIGLAQALDRPVIVMEDLTYIRERLKANKSQRRGLHSWAFKQLQEFIDYKAKASGIPVAYIDPRYTSQSCPHCGRKGKRNKKRRRFRCRNCEVTLNDDIVGARNIALKFYTSICRVERAVGLRPLGSPSI